MRSGQGSHKLFAPKTGEETQEELKEHARKLRVVAEERVREAQRHLEDRLDVAREGVSARYEEVRDGQIGRGAAMEARGDLEERLERSKSAYRAGVAAAREVAAAEEAED